MKNRNIPITHLLLALGLLALAARPAPAAAAGKVNINDATVEQLSYLPRVGAVVAQRIVEFREDNGPFKKTEELMLVQGIGEKTFELIEPYVVLEGETTLAEKVQPPKEEDR